jgi:hypothetical protein
MSHLGGLSGDWSVRLAGTAPCVPTVAGRAPPDAYPPWCAGGAPTEGRKGRRAVVAANNGVAGVPVEQLSRLRREVTRTRLTLRRVRADALPQDDVWTAQQQFVTALRLYTEALGSLGLPIPYTLRDELRIYGAAATARTRYN